MTKVYFKNLERKVISRLINAEESIKIAMAWIDLSIFEKSLVDLSSKGIKIEILLDENKKNTDQKKIIERMINDNLSINFVQKHNAINTMHHKFCIIDDKVILTGSFNWTINSFYNFENLIVIDNDDLATKRFIYEFNEIMLYRGYMNLVNKSSPITRLLYEEYDISHGGTEENNIYIYEVDNDTDEYSYSLYDTNGVMLTRDDTDDEEIYKWEMDSQTQEELDQIEIYKETGKLERMINLQSVALDYSRKNKKMIDGVIVKIVDEYGQTKYKTIWKNRFSKNIRDEYYF